MITRPTSAFIFGNDAAVGNIGPLAVGGLEAYAEKHSITLTAAWGRGSEAVEAALAADIIVLNPASLRREFDNQILAAVTGKKRVVILGDSWHKEYQVAEQYRSMVAACIVCFEFEVPEAISAGYRPGHVHNIIPPHFGRLYEDVMNTPALGSDTEMKLLTKEGGSVTVRRGDVDIYVEGVKGSLAVNNLLTTLAACCPPDAVIAFREHPSEKRDADEQGLKIIELRPGILNKMTRVDPDMKLDAAVLTKIAKVRIFTGGATNAIVSAYAGAAGLIGPSIYYSDPDVVEYNETQNMPKGQFFVPELDGAAYGSPANMRELLSRFLHNPNALLEVQKRHFTPPASWDTGLELADKILNG